MALSAARTRARPCLCSTLKHLLPVLSCAVFISTSIAQPTQLNADKAVLLSKDGHAGWPTDILDWKTSPVDLSFLNDSEKPAGKRGFVKAVKDGLVFEDGTSTRFWGTNITAYALFGTSQAGVKQQARRLSELGFNLVRLHHHDSPWVTPNIFGSSNTRDTKHLDAEMLDKLDWWIKCLKDEGIYVWLDLHVQRGLKSNDRIDDFDEIAKGKSQADLKGYNYVNSTIRQAMQRFNETYVTHYNRYTGLRYRDEPAIAAMLITNENDITNHFGNALLPDKKVPQHSKQYMKQAGEFAAAYGLPREKVWRAWEPGPAKLFLNDLEHRFNVEMISQLRALGVQVPIVTTSSWGRNPLSSLPSMTDGDMIDVHAYGRAGELEKNPWDSANLMHWIASAQLAGKPLSVTEWNVTDFPAADRHAIPLYMAGNARLQGWDALMHYAYSQRPLDNAGLASNWHAYNDPALIATLPAAALLYRQGHVREASTIYAFSPTTDTLFNHVISAGSSVALRTAAEKGKLVVVLPKTRELPWLEAGSTPSGATIITKPDASLLGSKDNQSVSDTGELRRNWAQGMFTINTSRTQSAMGKIGNQVVIFPDVEISLTTPNATIAVQSLDGKPISGSMDLLISCAARSILGNDMQIPYHSESVEGQLSIQAPGGLKLYKRMRDSAPQELSAPYRNGRYVITLTNRLKTSWLFLTRPIAK